MYFVSSLKVLHKLANQNFKRNAVIECCRPLSTRQEFAYIEGDENNLKPLKEVHINPLSQPDFFNIHHLVKLEDLFDARVHVGHREDTLHENMRPYIFGSRLGHMIFDLEQTASLLRDALNFAAHIAYRGGVILFVSRYYQHCPIVEKTAIDCQEYAHTRHWRAGLFANSQVLFGSTIRLPDLLILTSTLNDVLETHPAAIEGAKMNIPTIGIVDSNSDPTIITYPVPGNDDSTSTIELYCKLFKTAILKGKQMKLEISNCANSSNIKSL